MRLRGFAEIYGDMRFEKNKNDCISVLCSRLLFFAFKQGGGEENRTPVQTYPSKAFYMLILFYFFRELTGNKQPINSLAA